MLDRHDVADERFRRVCLNARGADIGPRLSGEFFPIAEHTIGFRHGGKSLRLGLRSTAGDDDVGLRPLAAQRADRLTRLAHGLRGHRAGVHHHRVGEPGLFGVPANHFGFRSVEPAAEGDDLHTHDAAPAPASKAASKRPLCSYSTGPVIST